MWLRLDFPCEPPAWRSNMVIGDGLMASAFAAYRGCMDVVIFASGVSDSTEHRPAAFRREQTLALDAISHRADAVFVYFSTCSILDDDLQGSPYVQHKRAMEEWVSAHATRHIIFRLPQVVGPRGNRATLVNFLYEHIMRGDFFDLWTKAGRSIIDVDDVRRIVSHILDEHILINRTLSLTTPPKPVLEIVRILERLTGRVARYREVDRGSIARTETDPDVGRVMSVLGIDTGPDYFRRVLERYLPGDNVAALQPANSANHRPRLRTRIDT